MSKANHTFYIDKRKERISLDGKWEFFSTKKKISPCGFNPEKVYSATLPKSVYHCLSEAGLLPDPYFGVNSKLYKEVDRKVWYFKRKFDLPALSGRLAYIVFEGVGYYSRVWINGEALPLISNNSADTHEGMFGGPIALINDLVHMGENEIIVEVTPPAPGPRYNNKYHNDDFDPKRAESEILPWNIRRDEQSSNGDFIVFGIWRGVRIELLPEYHLSRPYLYTSSLADGKAELKLEVELADPQINELDVLSCEPDDGRTSYTFAYAKGIALRPTGKKVRFGMTMTERSTGKLAFKDSEEVEIYDKSYISDNPLYRECQFIEKTITIRSPKLWQPNGLGDPELYDVKLELFDVSGAQLDELDFAAGIRTIEYIRTAGMRHRTRWDDYHFVVNGKPIFLKGMNWMPLDFLYDISDEDYRWALELAKNEGIQLLRVWSGGGMPEDDRFYRLCDEFGIMVMQDNFIANQITPEWNREVLAAQVCRNLYRIRNHPSLAVHTGGNEMNPYALGNDASMWVIAREIQDLDPSRKFMRTSPDKGSTHIYRDMEPVWYRKIYGQLPFVGESGIHSFPNAKSLRQQISPEEYERPLSDIFSENFKVCNPELHNHFTEFVPERIPRMMSRASMISDVRDISLSDLCDATQIASCEYYQIMIDSMRENYPFTCGIMPWVFKRSWTTVAIQLVDGLGDPIAPYYYVKNAYASLRAELSLLEVSYACGESISPELRIICDGPERYTGLKAEYEVFSPKLELVKSNTFDCDISPDEYMRSFTVDPFKLPENWNEKYFFLRASIKNDSETLNQGFYWCKVLDRLSDETFRRDYRSKPHENINFENGPWVKPQISATAGKLNVEIIGQNVYHVGTERRLSLKVRIGSVGNIFPVKLDIEEDLTLCYADDNDFFMPDGEMRDIKLEVRIKSPNLKKVTVTASAWNATAVHIEVAL